MYRIAGVEKETKKVVEISNADSVMEARVIMKEELRTGKYLALKAIPVIVGIGRGERIMREEGCR